MKEVITDKETYDLRFSNTTDEAELKRWLSDPEMRLWYPPSSDADVDTFVRNWIGFSRYRSSLTAVYEDKVVGVATIFLMPYIKVAHLCMMYIAVDPEFQRKGIGTSLIRNIKHLAKTRFRLESMHCEVWEGAPIVGLLHKLDFKEVVRQESFVRFPEGHRARLIIEAEL